MRLTSSNVATSHSLLPGARKSSRLRAPDRDREAAVAARAQVAPGSWFPTFAAGFKSGASDLDGWSYDLGGGGWGGNEKEVYTNSFQNSFVSGGALHIAATAAGTGANPNAHVPQTVTYGAPSGFSIADWHASSLAWAKGTATTHAALKGYVDGSLYETQSGGWYSPNGTMDAPFDKPFYLIMNVAVGGDYVGSPSLAAGA